MAFSKFSGSTKSGFFSSGSFQNFIGFKICSWFCSNSFVSNLLRFLKIGFVVLGQVLVSKRFLFAKSAFSGWRSFGSGQASEIGYIFSAKVSASLG